MNLLFQIHRIFGEMVLPIVIVGMAIYLIVTYRAGAPRNWLVRVFPILVDIQATLGVLYWAYLLVTTSGPTQALYIGFPFILHPIFGILAAGVAHIAVSSRGPAFLRGMGRWAPLASLGLLLVLVLSNVMIAVSA
jgi:hypothetical protein